MYHSMISKGWLQVTQSIGLLMNVKIIISIYLINLSRGIVEQLRIYIRVLHSHVCQYELKYVHKWHREIMQTSNHAIIIIRASLPAASCGRVKSKWLLCVCVCESWRSSFPALGNVSGQRAKGTCMCFVCFSWSPSWVLHRTVVCKRRFAFHLFWNVPQRFTYS